MQAGIHALLTLHEQYGPCEMELVSDSAYVVLGNQNIARKRNANTDLWMSLEMSQDIHAHVQWRHVPGHQGVKYNELADQLAVEAKRAASW